MRSIKPKEIIKILQDRGFRIVRQKGSHVAMKSYTDPARMVIIPLHQKDLKPGTLLSILRQAGISKEEIS